MNSMERRYGENSGNNLHKLMAMSGAISPIGDPAGRFYHPPPRKSLTFDARESLESPMIRYLRSPLAAIENLQVSPQARSPTVFKTPVKVEEDVLVMDGILVGPVTATSGRTRSSSSDSGGVSSSSSGTGKGFYRNKTEICRSWEDAGNCRYGAKCQFAHGKEELRPTRFGHKNKSEAQTSKSYSSGSCKSYSSGSCSYGSKCRFVHHQVHSPASSAESAVKLPFATSQRITPIKLEHDLSTEGSSRITFAGTDWSPLDDGIEVALPSTSTGTAPTREEVEAYVQSVLYSANQKKRLPVFVEICGR